MKKTCSEIGIWHPPGIPIILSQSMVFPYLYEKKMTNMKIENFKKSPRKSKNITTHPNLNISPLGYLSGAFCPNLQIVTTYPGRSSSGVTVLPTLKTSLMIM